MQFIDKAPLYQVVRITGPQHNLLGLQIALEPTEREPEIEILDQASGEPARLGDREVAEQVMLGVGEACRELNQEYYIEKIQYVAADSPPVEIYRRLAAELVRRISESRARRS